MAELIGAIVRRLEIALNDVVPPAAPFAGVLPADIVEKLRSVWESFDAEFADRPDYRLWRTGVTPHFKRWRQTGPSKISATWGDWKTAGLAAAESRDEEVFWGAVACARQLVINAKRDRDYTAHAPIWAVIDALYRRLITRPAALEGSPASCGFVAALFLTQRQYLFHTVRINILQDCLPQYLDDLRYWLRLIDPSWLPGKKLITTTMETERKGEGRLNPAHDIVDFETLVGLLRGIRPTIGMYLRDIDDQSQEMLEEAYNFAYSAWRAARSRRIHELQFQKTYGYTGSDRSREQRRKAFAVEFQCLQNLSNAARDAGFFLEGAKLSYMLFRLFPDEFIGEYGFQEKLKPIMKIVPQYVLEVGLEVDPRFTNTGKHRLIALKPEAEGGGNSDDVITAAANPSQPSRRRKFEDTKPSDEFRETQPIPGAQAMRLAKDQATDEAWKPLLAEIPTREGEPLPGYLLTVMHRLADPVGLSPAAIKGGYAIALKYGFVRTASSIVAHAIKCGEFDFTKKDIMDLVHAVRKCSRLDPFGMRFASFLKWRKTICDALFSIWTNKATDGEWLTSNERVWVHEALIGRTHTHHRSLNYDDACRLYNKASGAYEIENLREFYDYSYDFTRSARGVANKNTISKFCGSYRDSSLGSPVTVSILRIADLVSVVAIGENGLAFHEDLVLPDLEAQAMELSKESEFWFKHVGAPFSNKIEWPHSLRDIADAIIRLVTRIDSRARVIMVALDANLASLPWQHLICSRAPKRPGAAMGTEYLVALVPSLGAMILTKGFDQYFRNGIAAHLSDETDRVVREVSNAVQSSIRPYDGQSSASVCILVGHGSPRSSQRRMPTVRLGSHGELSSAEDWMSVLHHKHVVLHCCHTGRANAVFMHELGGVPGLAINLGVEVFCAPVTEVGAAAACELQRSLFAKPDNSEFGHAYLDAIARNPEVSLYNIYGNPYSRMLTAQDVVQAA
jgi:hypothetical protein